MNKEEKLAHVLLVEDNPADADLVLEAFEEARFRNTINVVEDGVEAIAYLKAEGIYSEAPEPDLVLLDINMPKKDGFEVLKEVKSDPKLRHIPIVMLTTSDNPRDIEKTYLNYANAYVTKPVDVEKFIQIVQKLEEFWFDVVKLPKDAK